MLKRKRNGAPSAFRQKVQRVMQQRAPLRPFRAAPRQAIMAGRRRAMLNMATQGLLGIERKFLDTARTAVSLVAPTNAAGGEVDPSTGCTGCLSAPAQGDGASNRDGKQIVAKYLEIRGAVQFRAAIDQTAAQSVKYVYVAVVLDTQTNGAQLNSEDVFVNTAASADGAPFPLRNLNFGNRFRVLRYELVKVVPQTMSWDGTNLEVAGGAAEFNWYIPLNNLKINFTSGTTADVANVLDNSLHVVAFATATSIDMFYNARMRFIG